MNSKKEYVNLLESVERNDWSRSSVNVNIPDHPEVRFTSPSGTFEVEISPVNGYDDGDLHPDNLSFFVNVYKYRLDEYGDRVSEDTLFSRKYDNPQKAVLKAELKIKKLS